MKEYLKYLGYGFLTFVSYYLINLIMVIITTGFYALYHDKIYGTWEIPRDPNIVTRFFAVLCVLYILILFGIFLFGRRLKFSNEKMPVAFILFIIPNLALQILIYYSYSIELMLLLNWYLAPLSDVFFFKTQTAYDLRFSYLGNSLLTYLPFIFAFLGGVTKRKKRQRKAEKEKTADNSES